MSSQLRYADRIEVRQAFFRSPFLDPSPMGGSSAVPGKGCSVAKVAAGPYAGLDVYENDHPALAAYVQVRG